MFDSGGNSGPGGGISPTFLLDVFNSVSDGVIAVDRDLRITAINKAALNSLGFPPHEAIGRPVGEILVTEDAAGRTVVADTLLGEQEVGSSNPPAPTTTNTKRPDLQRSGRLHRCRIRTD